jgi:hypothetical protein
VLGCRGETNSGLSSLRLVLEPRLGGGCSVYDPDWEALRCTSILARFVKLLPKTVQDFDAPALLYLRPLQTYACPTDIQAHLHPRYDTDAAPSSPHTLFAFRVFSHTNSNASNGGLSVWECIIWPQLLSQLGVLLPLDVRITRGVSLSVSTPYIQYNDSSSIQRLELYATNRWYRAVPVLT